VIGVLQRLWGDEMPPAQDPVQTVMTDAVLADDDHGHARGLVVQSDALSLDVLQQLLCSRGPVQERLLLLPPGLAQRLVGRVVSTSLPREIVDLSTWPPSRG